MLFRSLGSTMGSRGTVHRILALAGECQSLVLGPGLGREPGTQALVKALWSRVKLPMLVDADTFDAMRPHHLVPAGSQFDIQSGRKYLYPMINPKRFKQEIDVGHGIVSRRLMPGNEE